MKFDYFFQKTRFSFLQLDQNYLYLKSKFKILNILRQKTLICFFNNKNKLILDYLFILIKIFEFFKKVYAIRCSK